MRIEEKNAEIYDASPDQPVDPRSMSPEMAQQYAQQGQYAEYYPAQYQEQYPQEQQENDVFSRPNDLRVIQEYNREENMPDLAKKNFWSLASKSIKLGFWKEQDFFDLWLRQNSIKVNYIMSNAKHKYTFKDRLDMLQMEMLVYSDFKRGIGMERYKINERTLQATSVTQNIQGTNTGNSGKRGGIMSGLKNFFG